MSTIQIRGVPDEVHEDLTRLAEESGLSLNRLLLAELERLARRSRNASVLRRAAGRRGSRVATDDIVAMVRAERDSR